MAKFTSVPDLGRSKPTDATSKCTAAFHLQQFYTEFQALDVWDEDGWLITAVCEETPKGIFTHARKGTQTRTDYMPPETILYYAPLKGNQK